MFPARRDGPHAEAKRPKARADRRGDGAWRDLRRRYPEFEALDGESVYSLPEPIVETIDNSVPGFFTPRQAEFEFELARLTGGGFFLRRSLVGPTAPFFTRRLDVDGEGKPYWRESSVTGLQRQMNAAASPEAFIRSRAASLAAAHREMKDRLQRRLVRDPAEVADLKAARGQHQVEREFFARRDEAYAGWLVLNPEFRRELAELRTEYGAEVARRRGFPRRAARPGPEWREPRPGPAAAFHRFYTRWCLERMLTWDLPVPLEPRFDGAARAVPPDIREGLRLTLPWPILRRGLVDLAAVVERHQVEHAPKHLRGWLNPAPGRHDDREGDTTYQRLYWVYRIYELVLFRRYAAACRGKLAALDRATARVMGRDDDLVKKLRLRLARGLALIQQDPREAGGAGPATGGAASVPVSGTAGSE